MSNQNNYANFLYKKNEERINISRHKKQQDFVNAIDVAQNIKHLSP
jgi:hypothetical protein